MRLKNEQLLNIQGGALTASFINAATNALEMLYNFGKIVGKIIHQYFSKVVKKIPIGIFLIFCKI